MLAQNDGCGGVTGEGTAVTQQHMKKGIAI